MGTDACGHERVRAIRSNRLPGVKLDLFKFTAGTCLTKWPPGTDPSEFPQPLHADEDRSPSEQEESQ